MELSRGQNVQKQDGYRRKVMTGTVTTIVAQLFRVGATIGTVIVASRILSPTDYGIYAMAAPVTGFAFLFQNIGFDHAVVQSDDVSDVQLSSLFWLNIGLYIWQDIRPDIRLEIWPDTSQHPAGYPARYPVRYLARYPARYSAGQAEI